MHFISLELDSSIESLIKSLGFVTRLSVKYDTRQKHYEISGKNANVKKQFPIIKAFCDVHKIQYREWTNNKPNYKESVYRIIKG